MDIREAIKSAKESRFTLTSRILTNEKTQVYLTDQPHNPNPAWVDMSSLVIDLNSAHPKTKNEVEALVFDRAKLFHELGHVLYTDKGNFRHELHNKSSDPALFLDLSNILEDGRIERLLGENFHGMRPYLRAILLELMNDADKQGRWHHISGLVCYVREKVWRKKGDADFWERFQNKIDAAVAANHSDVACAIAFEIVEELSKGKPKQPEQPQEQEQWKIKNRGGKKTKGEGEESQEGEQGGGNESAGEKNGSGNGSGKAKKPTAEEIADAFDELVAEIEKTLAQLREEAESEYQEILEEIATALFVFVTLLRLFTRLEKGIFWERRGVGKKTFFSRCCQYNSIPASMYLVRNAL